MLIRYRRGSGGTQKNEYTVFFVRGFLAVVYLQQRASTRRLVRELRFLGQKVKSQSRRIGFLLESIGRGGGIRTRYPLHPIMVKICLSSSRGIQKYDLIHCLVVSFRLYLSSAVLFIPTTAVELRIPYGYQDNAQVVAGPKLRNSTDGDHH